VKITILKERKQKKRVDEAWPAIAGLVGSAVADALDDEPGETADSIVDKSQNKPIMVQAHGDEFRSIKRILQAIQAQLIKMGGGGERKAAAGPDAGVVAESDIE